MRAALPPFLSFLLVVMGAHLSKLRSRLFGGRSRSGDPEVEYSDEAIRKKFDNMPKLTNEERIVLKSSWRVIKKKINTVRRGKNNSNRYNRFLN